MDRFSNLYKLLLEYNWKKSSDKTRNGDFRKNAYSLNVGQVRLFRKGLPIVDGNKMKKNKSLIHNEIKRLFPNYYFTGVMINKNLECPPHKDKGNDGGVIVIGLGDYEGGELVIDGVEHNVKNKEIRFDAHTLEHYVKPFKGDRYSVVIFKHKNHPILKDWNGWE